MFKITQLYPIPPIEWHWMPDRRLEPIRYKAKVLPVEGKKLDLMA